MERSQRKINKLKGMVQETELRIGNIVDAGTVVRVAHNKVTIRKDHKIFSCPPIILRPIPLTPEILEKTNMRYDLITWSKDCLMIAEGDGGYDVWIALFGSGRIALKLKYLHQLQNLYFALTSTELEIKM